MKRVSITLLICSIVSVIIPYSVFAQPVDFEVDVLWEAINSYTPPFYKGKAMPPLEANISAVAIATGLPGADLMYTWEKDEQRQAAQSGRNKDLFGYIGTPLDQQNSIAVTVSSPSGTFEKRKSAVIPYQSSEVLFYEDDSQLGTLFNKNIKNGHIVGDSKKISLTAIPYFLSADTLSSKSIEMIWAVNNGSLPEQKVKNKIILEGLTGTSGESVISIFIKNKIKIFEEGKVGVSLQF